MEVVGTPIPGFKLFKQLAVSGSLALPPGWKRIPAGFPRGTLQGVVLAKKQPSPRGPGIRARAGSGTGGGSGPELFKVADIHMMRVYVQVPQQLSAGIKAGLTAELHLPQYPNKTFKGAVATTSSAINPNARTLLVELHADNPDGELQPGAYAQVDFELPSDPDIVRILTSALVFREQGMEVAAIDANGTIELRPIKLGRNLGTEVEVVQGLKLSDRLVNSPPDSLATGDKVRVAGAPQESGAAEQQTREPSREENAAEPKPH
jgi:multidrug efflux pump subunit AcrA (membrane-fusion protein)